MNDNPFLRCGCGATWPCAQHLDKPAAKSNRPLPTRYSYQLEADEDDLSPDNEIDVFTAEQMHTHAAAARAQALEEAAQVCDAQMHKSDECADAAVRVTHIDMYTNTAIGAKFCAAAIRALLKTEGKG